MFFKNLLFYQLTEKFTLSPAELQDRLYNFVATPCGKLENTRLGWAPPLGRGYDSLLHVHPEGYVIALQREDKILPQTVVREKVLARIDEIESSENRQVSRQEKRQLMEEFSIALLPQAFSKVSTTYAFIHVKENLLLIDTANKNKAEELTVLLRQSLGSLKLLDPLTQESVRAVMTRWLNDYQLPKPFCIETYCELSDPRDEKISIRCNNQDLCAQEIKQHLVAGKIVDRLGLSWDDKLAFILDHDLILRRIQLLDILKEGRELDKDTDKAIQFEADLTLFLGACMPCLAELILACGGMENNAAGLAVVEEEMEVTA